MPSPARRPEHRDRFAAAADFLCLSPSSRRSPVSQEAVDGTFGTPTVAALASPWSSASLALRSRSGMASCATSFDGERKKRMPKFTPTPPAGPESYSSQMHTDTINSGWGRAGERVADMHHRQDIVIGLFLFFSTFFAFGMSVGGEHLLAFVTRKLRGRVTKEEFKKMQGIEDAKRSESGGTSIGASGSPRSGSGSARQDGSGAGSARQDGSESSGSGASGGAGRNDGKGKGKGAARGGCKGAAKGSAQAFASRIPGANGKGAKGGKGKKGDESGSGSDES